MDKQIKISERPSEKRLCRALYLNDDHFCDLHYAIFGKGLSLPKEADSLDRFKEAFYKLEFQGAFQYAVKRLSLRSLLREDLRRALKERLVSIDTIEKVVTRCQELNFLNDAQWYANYAAYLVRKRYGPKMMVMKLRAKGLCEEEAYSLISKLSSSSDEREQIAYLLKTKYHKRDLADFKERQKVVGALYRKGFSLEQILSQIG